MKVGKQSASYEHEVILAWRVWLYGDEFINKECAPILHSIALNGMGGHYTRPECPWKAGEANEYPYLFKSCGPDGGDMFDGSQGGIYAWKGYMNARLDTWHLPGANVWGAVWLWGKVYEHWHGYRSQFGYPAAVCSMGSQPHLNAIATRYQIPTIPVGLFESQTVLEKWVREHSSIPSFVKGAENDSPDKP